MSKIRAYSGLLHGLATGSIGSGTGFLLRSRYEDRHKKDGDKTLEDKLLAYAPVIGGVVGFAGGGVYGHRRAKGLKNFIRKSVYGDRIRSNYGLPKHAALKKDVVLKPHQKEVVEHVEENNGNLLMAHATGSGKTLSGIASFENLKAKGKANKALVVVPASLRHNFVNNGIKAFTNSSVSVYGPKNETDTKNVNDSSNSTYSVISYDLFRDHGPEIIKNTGADTLIMDEVHRARATEGVTYNKLKDLRSNFKNVITLTGSVVNNDPNEVVPLLDITYGSTGHKLVNKKFFDKLFINATAETQGFFNPKTVITRKLKNKPQLAKYLSGQVSFIPHDEVEKLLPKKDLETVYVHMTPEQKRLYDFSLSSVDPVTRWKIRNNLPVGQKEASEAFGKLMQARQISTDPSVLDKNLSNNPDPASYSPKIKRIVDDLEEHLGKDKKNNSVIFGNLLVGQMHAVEKALEHRKIPFTTFYGVGNEGNSAKKRISNLEEFQSGKKKVILLSGAGAEGLDLKNANLIQMVEGHYNPERIHQAESRIRRLGSDVKSVQVKRYISVPSDSKAGSFISALSRKTGLGGETGVDAWIYTIAKRKDDLNSEFRDVLNDRNRTVKTAEDESESAALQLGGAWVNHLSNNIGTNLGGFVNNITLARKTDLATEKKFKQTLIDKGYENLTNKKHLPKVLAESKLDEKALDAKMGLSALVGGVTLLSALHPKAPKPLLKPFAKALSKVVKPMMARSGNRTLRNAAKEPHVVNFASQAAASGLIGFATPFAIEKVKQHVLESSIHPKSKDLDIGINNYLRKQKNKYERKYKTSKGFVSEYETKKELGIEDDYV